MRSGAPVDLHHNLFYSYRGASIDDADRERQLENNLTRALINTLELGGETVWRPFLAEVDLGGAIGHFQAAVGLVAPCRRRDNA